jgi:outer membrane lipoprotein-sorting protein
VQTANDEKSENPGDVVLRCVLRGAGKQSQDTTSAEVKKPAEEVGESVLIEIVEKTGELVRITVRDPGGIGIEFHFTDWLADPPVDDSFFHFHVPAGVAIVNGELPAGHGGVNP